MRRDRGKPREKIGEIKLDKTETVTNEKSFKVEKKKKSLLSKKTQNVEKRKKKKKKKNETSL